MTEVKDIGMAYQHIPWILHCDKWYRNPYYFGPLVANPEDSNLEAVYQMLREIDDDFEFLYQNVDVL